MAGKAVDAKTQVARMASLSVAWGLLAGVAFLGLIKSAVDYAKAHSAWPGFTVDGGLSTLNVSRVASNYQSLTHLAVIALPIAAGAVIALGIATRVRPTLPVFAVLALVAAVIGLLSAGVIFAAEVVNAQNETSTVVAVATIVLVGVLLRLQRFIRHFYRRTPAFTSLLFVAVTLAYLILSNGSNLSTLILSQVHVWLALIAFLIALYATISQVRAGRRLAR
ncbi:MAG TPA: hypothetical protein VGR57_13105 [Ktedonobacterales bacterium]|nr:hypothetical protein [Ktedonobacterales bacterium]